MAKKTLNTQKLTVKEMWSNYMNHLWKGTDTEEELKEVEKLLPFEDEEEHQEWLEKLKAYKGELSFDDLMIDILSRIEPENSVESVRVANEKEGEFYYKGKLYMMAEPMTANVFRHSFGIIMLMHEFKRNDGVTDMEMVDYYALDGRQKTISDMRDNFISREDYWRK